MFYRCLNNFWGYCKGKPDTDAKLSENNEAFVSNATCKLDKATCSKYSTTHCSKEIGDGRES